MFATLRYFRGANRLWRTGMIGILLVAVNAPWGISALSVEELVREVARLQELISSLQQSPAASVSSESIDILRNLPRTLSRGAQGADVTAVQQFLIREGFLAEGNATGYFGVLTEAAVKRFQAARNIVSSGTAETTGYGVVGQKTRAAIAGAVKRESDTVLDTPAASTMTPQQSAALSELSSSGSGTTLLGISAALKKGVWEYSKEPVITKGAAGKWDSHSAYNPRIVKKLDGSTYQDASGYYYLYYTASNGADNTDYDATGLAISKDLIHWTKVSIDAPVLPRGAAGYVDAGDASAVTVLHDGSKFLMWHEANATPPGNQSGDYVRIAYAESTDGKVWQKHGWVIGPGNSTYDRQDVYAPVVIKDGSTWKMWYTGHDESGRFGVMAATAPEPRGPWTRVSDSFVFHPSDSTFPSEVWKEGDTLYMTYGAHDGMWFAKKVSGTAWQPVQNISTARSPRWHEGDMGSWPSHAIKDGTLYQFYGASVYYGGGIGYRTTSLAETATELSAINNSPATSNTEKDDSSTSVAATIPVVIHGPTNDAVYTQRRIPQVWGYCDSRAGHVSVALGNAVATAGCEGNKFVVDNFDHQGNPGNIALRAQQTWPNGSISAQQINVRFDY